jgi:hypothetical protein
VSFKDRKTIYSKIRQINFTPTLALALGIPIPYSNLGIAILDIFGSEKLDAIKANYLQVTFVSKLINLISN